MVYLAAKMLKCDPGTVYNYRNRYPQVSQLIEDLDNEMDDIAESALRQALLQGEAWAVCFRLKTKGKHRGYVEKSEQDINLNVREVALPIKAERDEWTELYVYNESERPRT